MMRQVSWRLAIAGVAATLALAGTPSVSAAPVSLGAAALKGAVASDVMTVQGYYHRRGSGYRDGPLSQGYYFTEPMYDDPSHYYYGPPPAHYVPRPRDEYYQRPSRDDYYSRPRRNHYYSSSRPSFFEPSYGVPEPYPDPNGARRQCWVSTDRDRGFGYFRPC
jgi:hypothetical protein